MDSATNKLNMKTFLHHSFFIFSFLVIVFVTIINGDGDADYMSDLMKALTPTPTGWSNNIHYCKWNGILCQSNRVVSIKLPSSSLSGTFPPNFNTLTNITYIDLHNNSLTGSLPNFYGLAGLQTVSLGHNMFTSIPPGCFQLLHDLRTLNLSNNLNLDSWAFPITDLTFSISTETIDLEATNMIGSLPPEMFNTFPSLNTFILSHNNITGSLPLSLGESRVRCLRLNHQGFSRLSGTIDVISSMRFLSQAWLHNNLFTGPIPTMFNSTYLSDLQLKNNLLTGLVPSSLLALTSLNNISLDNNAFQGPIPAFRKGVKATWEGNRFCRNYVGPCDPQLTILLEIMEAFGYPILYSSKGNNACTVRLGIICQKGKIVSIDFGYEKLKGTISPAFSNLTSLVNLTLAGNYLKGSIPDSLASLPQLQLLDVSDNNLSGKIPKFPSKVKLITEDNALLSQKISQQLGDGQNATASRDRGGRNAAASRDWITGMYARYICFNFVLFSCHVVIDL